MHSLEELEARMRGGVPPSPHIEPPRVNKTDEDMSAFKKLLAQVSGGQVVPAANGPIAPKQNTQHITLMQLLKNQQGMGGPPPPHQPPMPEQQQQHAPSFNHVGPLGPAQHPHQAQMQHENLMKVLRIQQVGPNWVNCYFIFFYLRIDIAFTKWSRERRNFPMN